MPKIFISYRRSDAFVAQRIYQKLAERYGEESVIIDLKIPAGKNFVKYLKEHLNTCDILIAVIGGSWMARTWWLGRRRINMRKDYVRLEIATALWREIPVIPVLVGDHTSMPETKKLPDNVKQLSLQNAAKVRPGLDTEEDLNKLVDKVDRSLKEDKPPKGGPPNPPVWWRRLLLRIRRLLRQIWRWFKLNVMGWLRTLLKTALILTLLASIAILALQLGVRITWSDFINDRVESAREELQRALGKRPSSPFVRYKSIRPVYYSGVRYEIESGEYNVPEGGFTVEKDSEVHVKKGTKFKIPAEANILVAGKFTAQGDTGEEIRFVPVDESTHWGNITFFGEGTVGSALSHCVIEGGTGRAALGSDTGYFDLSGSGKRVGGGLLLYGTTITVADTKIVDCTAMHGGGIYIRNPVVPDQSAQLPGSTFTKIIIERCSATGFKASGGGGIMVKNSYPEFSKCEFSGNRAIGDSSCGGAVYMGQASRGLFEDCKFTGNDATAEGGALYIYQASDYGDDNSSGIVVRRGDIEKNKASGSGGAISAHNSRVALLDVNFKDNQVAEFKFAKGISSNGGAVHLNYDKQYKCNIPTKIDGCRFTGNGTYMPDVNKNQIVERDYAGGGICVFTEVQLNLSITASQFSNNKAYRGCHCALPDKLDCVGWKDDWDPKTQFNSPALTGPMAIFLFPSFTTKTN
jgi:hypothetical protein